MGKKILSLMLIMLLQSGILIGCREQEEINYSVEGVSEDVEDSALGRNEVQQYAEETSWVDSWRIEEGVNRPTIEITVDAQIALPDVEEMYVVEVEVAEFDTAFKERLVRVLYDEGNVYYGDMEHLPKAELEALYADCVERYENASTESEREIIKVSMAKYEELLEDAKDTYTLADSFETGQYIGERNGMTYELWVSGAYGENGWDVPSQWFNFYAASAEEFCPDIYENYNTYMAHPFMTCEQHEYKHENECEISREEAQEQAEELLEQMGLEYPVLAYTKPLIWGDETLNSSNINKDWPANGYVFTYEYGLDNVSFTGFGTDYLYYDGTEGVEGELLPYEMHAFARIYVTDKGIVNVHAECPVETVSVSESVELLPLDTIKSIMKEEMPKVFESAHSSGVLEEEYTHMELIYFRVKDEGNVKNYSYIPAWRLSRQHGDSVQGNWVIYNPMIVNAIDGSFINIAEEK